MKRSVLLVVGVLLTLMVAGGANAQGTKRIRNQDVRIRQGVRNGSLTRREARRLHTDERSIQRRRRHSVMSGHRYTAAERARIARMENRQSRRIYRLKHNRTRRS